jgi:uncharacterized protein
MSMGLVKKSKKKLGGTKMNFRRVGTCYILRLEKGEEFIGAVTDFLKKYGITAGSISAIGATNDVIIGYFDVEKKEYHKKRLKGDYEILHIAGNTSMVGVDPLVHAHITLGDENYQVMGGHLFSALISVTCEVYIQVMDSRIERTIDEETGLKLLRL